jgi:ribosomal protein L32E
MLGGWCSDHCAGRKQKEKDEEEPNIASDAIDSGVSPGFTKTGAQGTTQVAEGSDSTKATQAVSAVSDRSTKNDGSGKNTQNSTAGAKARKETEEDNEAMNTEESEEYERWQERWKATRSLQERWRRVATGEIATPVPASRQQFMQGAGHAHRAYILQRISEVMGINDEEAAVALEKALQLDGLRTAAAIIEDACNEGLARKGNQEVKSARPSPDQQRGGAACKNTIKRSKDRGSKRTANCGGGGANDEDDQQAEPAAEKSRDVKGLGFRFRVRGLGFRV